MRSCALRILLAATISMALVILRVFCTLLIFIAFLKSKYPAIIEKIAATNDLDKDTEQALEAAIEDFKKTGVY